MKTSVITKTAAVVVAFMAIATGLFAQTAVLSKPETNTTLTYKVKTAAEAYDLTVIVKTFGPEVSFDWVKTGGTVNEKGTVSFNNADASDAMGLNNFFTAGAMELHGQTGIWVSKMAYKLMKARAKAAITFDNGAKADDFVPVQQTGTYKANVNGTETALPFIKTASNTKEIVIVDDVHNPLIVSIHAETWTMELVSITQ